MPITAGARFDRYEILTALGAGGMGEVYLAQDLRLGRKVALKLLPAESTKDEDRVRRFEQEARAASALNHPNILTIYEIGQVGDAHFIATEYVEGQTLRQVLAAGPQPLVPALDVVAQTAGALAAAHAAGIVHRDIKPENVMLRPDGYVKVLDFGLAKLTQKSSAGRAPSGDSAAATMVRAGTEPGTVLGTTSYMSPEQARGLPVDARSDIFSLGVVLFEMVTGSAPFAGPTTSDVIAAILRAEPPPLAQYLAAPTELEWIVAKALTKDPEGRYQTAREMMADLRRLRQRLELEAELGRSNPSGLGERRRATGDPSLGGGGRQQSASGTRRSTAPRRPRARRSIDSLAVLPLVNASADPNAEYLSDGITESIINSLSQLPKLRVVPRSTVFRYKGREADPQEAGRELGVRAVLTGRVLLVSDTLVIKTELIDIAQESQLWGEQYQRKLTDIFALQEELSRDISEKLRLRLSGEEKRRLTKRYTENTEAYHLYLKGRYYSNKRTGEWLRKGIEYFQQAIDVDPNYALAYAGLADAYALLGSATGGLAPAESYPRAKAAALKALEVDDTLAEARSSLGFFRLLYDWDWAAAAQEFKRAVELNPGYAPAHDGYGFYCKVTGQFDEAIRACRRAQELDPLSLFINISLGWAYYYARRYDEAIEQSRKTLEMDPNFGFAYWNMGLALEQQGRYPESVAAFQRAVTLSGGGLTFLAHLGRACAVAGRRDEAVKILEDLQQESRRRYVSAYYFAIIHLGLGDKDQTLAWLEQACQERSGFMAFIKVEPVFDSLRLDARFQDLLRRVGH